MILQKPWLQVPIYIANGRSDQIDIFRSVCVALYGCGLTQVRSLRSVNTARLTFCQNWLQFQNAAGTRRIRINAAYEREELVILFAARQNGVGPLRRLIVQFVGGGNEILLDAYSGDSNQELGLVRLKLREILPIIKQTDFILFGNGELDLVDMRANIGCQLADGREPLPRADTPTE